jgi:hypothetical protein
MIVLTLISAPGIARAYPIFYTCDSGGHARDYLDTKDVQAYVLDSLAASKSDSEIEAICQGKAECFSVLKQALLLTQESAAAADQIWQDEVRAIEKKSAELSDRLDEDRKVDPSISETAKNLIVMADTVNECRKAQIDLPPEDFKFPGHDAVPGRSSGQDLFIQHGVDNEYLYVSGIWYTDSKNRKVDYDKVKTIISDAAAMGVDPYAALAVAFMEAGEAKPFVLDTAPMFFRMGCSSRLLASVDAGDEEAVNKEAEILRQRGQPFYFSFGKFYELKPKVNGGPETQVYKQMEKIRAGEAGSILVDGPGLACVEGGGSFVADANEKVIDAFGLPVDGFSVSDACCTRIPYVSKRAFAILANQTVADKIKEGGSDPSAALQRFNGTGVIGLTEKSDSVGGYRYGIDMEKYPQYGDQAMDFILNSFMGNPMIRHFVDQAEAKYDVPPKSLICSGKGPGTYTIDSDKYVDRERDTVRFSSVIGKSWSALNSQEKGMVRGEFDLVISQKDWQRPGLSEAEYPRYQAAVEHFASISGDEAKWNDYRKNVYPFRNTLGRTSSKSWKRLTDSQVLGIRQKILAAPSQDEADRRDKERRQQ